MAQQSVRRGRKNQMNPSCPEHAFMIWFRSANSHTGPQLLRCIRGRTDGSIRLRADILQKPLASRGASTDGFTAWIFAICGHAGVKVAYYECRGSDLEGSLLTGAVDTEVPTLLVSSAPWRVPLRFTESLLAVGSPRRWH
jgi:hypothetical protein